MDGGPFEIDSEYKSVLRKSDLTGNGRMSMEVAE